MLAMFSEKLVEALKTGRYMCPECKDWLMVFEDEVWRDVLVCTNPECSYSCYIDEYGKEEGEDELDYPTEEEARRLLGEVTEEENQYDEIYEEVYNELDD